MQPEASAALQSLYRDSVLEHNRNPRNHGQPSEFTHSARGLNALCGDDITVFAQVDADTIISLHFIGEPSAITMASASMMCEVASGKSRDFLLATKRALENMLAQPPDQAPSHEELGNLVAFAGVKAYPSRIRAVLLPWAALEAALNEKHEATTE